jgi:hypothetical protein
MSFSSSLLATDADGSSSITYSVASGTLPAGITLSSSGVLSGTPTQNTSGPFPFTVRATDSGGNYTDQNFSITHLYSILHMDPSTISGNDSTWTDRSVGTILQKTGTTNKSGTYQVYMSSGNKWGYSTVGSSPKHLASQDFGANDFSVELWLYIPTAPFSQSTINYGITSNTQQNAGWRTFVNNGTFWSKNEYNIYVNSPGTNLGFSTSDTNGLEYALSSIGTGWKHIFATRDANGRKLYINGTQVASDTVKDTLTVDTNNSFNINGRYNGSSIFETDYGDQQARFGSIRVYNASVAGTSISTIYNAEKSRYGL